MAAPSLRGVIDALERRYPPSTAEDWDAVGLVCGDPSVAVSSVLWAVDPVAAVAEQALDLRVELLVTHHPLFLSPVHSVAATDAKGSVVHRLIRGGIALYVAHTNADVAAPGVSDALASALGVRDARPLDGAPSDAGTGLGRIGLLPEATTLAEYAAQVAGALPATRHGVRVLGDPARPVRTVAVCGGSGDSLLAMATLAGADAYVTADLKHHRALEHAEEGGCAVIDVAHWASEWPWLAQASDLLVADLAAEGATVESQVSALPTDPWSAHLESTSGDRESRT
ncbi:MAG: Nif3-like dinuclear metal center hexameric protein [bacterium]